MRGLSTFAWLLLVGSAAISGCSDQGFSEAETIGADEAEWDSEGGNPTHPVHSRLTEFAIDELGPIWPELETYRDALVAGSNKEIHDLVLTSDPNAEQIRRQIGGNNWGCDHPEYVWAYAKYYYARGDKKSAYWFLGLLLHYVQDAGVPAHAFHVIHQNKPWNWDNFEVQAFATIWNPSFENRGPGDPQATSPVDYVKLGVDWAIRDFHRAYPGATYRRTFFSLTPMSNPREYIFLTERQGHTALSVKWALRSAVRNWQ